MRSEGMRAEHIGESPVADIEPARIGPEGRHHQAIAVAHEAAPRNDVSAPAHSRHRMEMAGDFAWACLRCRLVAKHKRTKRERSCKNAADAVGGFAIMVTSDPNPIAPALQPQQFGAVSGRKARR